jgi:hypothetical protein
MRFDTEVDVYKGRDSLSEWERATLEKPSLLDASCRSSVVVAWQIFDTPQAPRYRTNRAFRQGK